MAVESRIDADDEWFVGEDRVFRFSFVDGDTSDIAGWAMTFSVYPRKSRDEVPLLVVPAVGIVPGTLGERAAAVVQVTAQQSVDLGAGHYQFVLRRVDPGNAQVLSYGPAELRTAVRA